LKKKLALAIHGGAGALKHGTYPEDEMREYMRVLLECRTLGGKLLSKGTSALDTSIAVVKILEDCPLFNAGIGSVYNSEKIQEMDASLMDGKSMNVAGIALVTKIKNPIEGAQCVMEKSTHSLLAGSGAHRFLEENGMTLVDEKIFHSDRRLKQLKIAKEKGIAELDHSSKMGTVGCVALDCNGNLAAANSTGGITNRLPGRISDTCIAGAGIWAENGVVAIAATGTGDQFIAGVIAYDLAVLMKYKNLGLEAAASSSLKCLKDLGGSGGFALIDSKGNILLPFNTAGMFRAWWNNSGDAGEAVYLDD